MDSFKQYIIKEMGEDDCVEITEVPAEQMIDEAGNISSAIAIKKANDAIKFGRQAISAKRLEDKVDALARQNGAISSLVLMSVAVSGKSSFASLVAKGLSVRNL